jgi:NAD(P)-dependent dehydrogenase (short-subunit alcohol dehydrogenase family)
MSGICEGRVVVVTGAGRGIGREYALELARQGAMVVVNDLGAEPDGTGASTGPAGEVVEEIRGMGAEAVADGEDVSDVDGAARMIQRAIDTFGRIDVLINNAGILRDRMLVNMTEAEWDAVIKVHLKGTFAPAHHAAAHWRALCKESGAPVDARIINTTSVSGIFGNPGQTNYGAAKAGIAGFTVIAARELERYGVTVNAISPGALTRLTEDLNPNRPTPKEGEFNPGDPANIAPVAVWLASSDSREVTGRVFIVSGGTVSVAEGWERGPTATKEARWDPAELGDVLPGLVSDAQPNSTMGS